MKFSEMPYTRPDLDVLRRAAETAVAALDSATSAQAQLEAYRAYETAAATAQTMCSLCEIRHTIDTRDPFYEAEQDYLDEVSPQMEELDQQVSRALLRSPFRAELSEALGKLLFTNLEIQVRSFDPVLLPLMLLTGLAMSPGVNAVVPLPDLFGGRQSARTVHFIVTNLLVLFVIVHVLLVLLSGVANNMRSMITGWFVIERRKLPAGSGESR